jgi:hypothetical protein
MVLLVVAVAALVTAEVLHTQAAQEQQIKVMQEEMPLQLQVAHLVAAAELVLLVLMEAALVTAAEVVQVSLHLLMVQQ